MPSKTTDELLLALLGAGLIGWYVLSSRPSQAASPAPSGGSPGGAAPPASSPSSPGGSGGTPRTGGATTAHSPSSGTSRSQTTGSTSGSPLGTCTARIWQEGMSGGCVKDIQALLNARDNAGLAVDGVFGPLTRQAVITFQQRQGITVDGIVGPQTWARLLAPHPTQGTAAVTTASTSCLARDWSEGSSGPCVTYIQSLLNQAGAHLATDGQFGPQTASAVRQFQQDHGLTVDGIVGPQTWGALLHVVPAARGPSLVPTGVIT